MVNDPDLYDHFGTVTQRNGAYTFQDYGEIITHLNEAWDIDHRSLSGQGGQGSGLHLPAAGTLRAPGGSGRGSTRRTTSQPLLVDPWPAGLAFFPVIPAHCAALDWVPFATGSESGRLLRRHHWRSPFHPGVGST